MDWASLGGIALALIGIFIGQSIDGGRIGSLLQPSAFFIVTFGTFGAVLLQSRPVNFRSGIAKLKYVFVEPIDKRTELAMEISEESLLNSI